MRRRGRSVRVELDFAGMMTLLRDTVITVCPRAGTGVPPVAREVRPVVKIRYAELPDGMHAQVQGSGRRAVIYLAPGLSPAQRAAALRRLIRGSRSGHGPRLRRPAVSFAVARDNLRTTLRNGAAAARCHPVGSLLLAGLLTAAVVCYAVFVSVTIRLNPRPSGPPVAQGTPPAIRESGVPLPGSGPGRPGGAPGGPSGGTAGPPGASSAAARPRGGSAPSAAGAPSQLAASPTSLATASGPRPSPSAQPSSPAPTPAPSSSSGNPGGVCVTVGPLGVCVSV